MMMMVPVSDVKIAMMIPESNRDLMPPLSFTHTITAHLCRQEEKEEEGSRDSE